jgi:hypothetical protein
MPCPECGKCECSSWINSWISVNENLPKQFELVWIYWKDKEVLLGCRTEVNAEPLKCWYSIKYEKCSWANWWRPYRIETPGPPKLILHNWKEEN